MNDEVKSTEDVIQRTTFAGINWSIAEGKQLEAGEAVNAESGNPDGDNSKWTENTCLLLISEYQKLKPKVGSERVPSRRKMWRLMEATFEQKGHLLKSQQLEIKWKTMKRAYKVAQKNKRKAGRGRKNCPFEKELHEILGARHAINPHCIADSQGVHLNENLRAERENQPAEDRESPLSDSVAGIGSGERDDLDETETLTSSDSDSSEDENTPNLHPLAGSTAATSTKNKRKRSREDRVDAWLAMQVERFRHEAEARSLRNAERTERRHAEKMAKLHSLMGLFWANLNK